MLSFTHFDDTLLPLASEFEGADWVAPFSYRLSALFPLLERHSTETRLSQLTDDLLIFKVRYHFLVFVISSAAFHALCMTSLERFSSRL